MLSLQSTPGAFLRLNNNINGQLDLVHGEPGHTGHQTEDLVHGGVLLQF